MCYTIVYYIICRKEVIRVPLKILHCADLHLDTVFGELSESSAKCRREDLRSAFNKIISSAKENNVDMLIISGDLFDEGVTRHTVKFVKEKLKELSHIPVYICAGNHDPKTSDSYYSLEDFGKHVHVFDTHMEWIEKDEYDIYGMSFGEAKVNDSFLAGFKVKNPDKINIMVMHGDFTSNDYNLITKSQIKESGIDYLALGHIHKYEKIDADGALAVYPGCPEGRGFDETGDKGVVLAEIKKHKKDITFLPISRRKYHELLVDVNDLGDNLSVCEKIKEQINENDLYKIVLTGETDFEPDGDVIKDNLDAFFVKVYDKTRPKIDLLKSAEEFSLKGLFIKKALEKIENDGDETDKMALKIGLGAIEGR